MNTITQLNYREQRGIEIAKMNNQIQRINSHAYIVKSQSNNGEYCVSKDEEGWHCECPDHIYRRINCKHIYAVQISLSLRAEVAVRRIEPIGNFTESIFAHPAHFSANLPTKSNVHRFS